MRLPLQSIIERTLYVAMLLLAFFNIFTTVLLYNFISEGRELSIQRQVQTEAYIKCVLLLRYDNPELDVNSTREEVEMALDKCASVRTPNKENI